MNSSVEGGLREEKRWGERAGVYTAAAVGIV